MPISPMRVLNSLEQFLLSIFTFLTNTDLFQKMKTETRRAVFNTAQD